MNQLTHSVLRKALVEEILSFIGLLLVAAFCCFFYLIEIAIALFFLVLLLFDSSGSYD